MTGLNKLLLKNHTFFVIGIHIIGKKNRIYEVNSNSHIHILVYLNYPDKLLVI